MKPSRWFILLLVILTVALMLRLRTGKAPTTTSATPPENAATEVAGTASPADPAEAAAPVAPAVVRQREMPPPEEDGNHLQVIVQNELGQALGRAEVRSAIRVERGSTALTNFNRTLTTSSRGFADVLWPKQKFEQLEVQVSKDDYASHKMVWDLKTGDVIPPSYVFKLKGGIQLGGYVVDPDGNPVAEAEVSLFRFWSGGDERQSKGEEPAFPRQQLITKQDGRWTARGLPSELLQRIMISAAHTNFIGVQISMQGKPSAEQELKSGIYKLQLKRGLGVHGRVIDERQEPIAEAKVWAGRKFNQYRQETKTDAHGRFAFRNVNEGMVDFSVMADGYAPATEAHPVDAAAAEIVFQMKRGSIIRGLVQDESSQPIAGVRAALEGSPGQESYDRFQFSTTTDGEGRFEWRSAPSSPMPFYFGKSGYMQKRGVLLKPVQDNVVVLYLNRQVEGLVLNAETGGPVTNFTVEIGRYYGPEQFSVNSYGSKQFKSDEGTFTMEIDEENKNGIRVTASGYSEQAQILPKAEDGLVKVTFKLKPSKSLVGVVVTSAGQPVPGANVALVDGKPGGRTVQFARGQLRSSGTRAKILVTDASGRFEIPSPSEGGSVVAANGSGYGSATVADVLASGVLTLQAFGRIQGVLVQGAAVGVGQELLVTSSTPGVYFEFESSMQTTDNEGRFTFENVPAGTISIVRLVKTSARSKAHSHSSEVVVMPGQTTEIVLGGVNATLFGQVKFETPPTETEYSLSAQLFTARPQIPKGLTPEQMTALLGSTEWKEQTKSMKRYSAAIGADGSLLLDSVAPGHYTLQVTAQRLDEDPLNTRPVAFGETTVTVQAGADPTTPIQIGEVILKPTK